MVCEKLSSPSLKNIAEKLISCKYFPGKKEKELSREKDSKPSRAGAGSSSKEKGSRSKKTASNEDTQSGKKNSKPSAEPVEPVIPNLVQENESALPK